MSGTCIVQRGKRFAVVAYAGIDPATQKERRKWFGGFTTRKEAEQFRLTLAHHPSFSGGVGPYGSLRLRTGDYLAAWLSQRIALGHLRTYHGDCTEKRVIRLYLSSLNHVPLSRLSPAAIDHLQASLLSRGLARATVRRALNVLHAALQDALRQGLILHNPQDNTTPVRIPARTTTVLTQDQTAVYFDDAARTATPALYAAHLTAALCGLRPGEVFALRETDVEIKTRLLHVRQTLVRSGAVPEYGTPKTERGRRAVLLPDPVIRAIRAAIAWKREERLKRGPRYRDSALLFVGDFGRPLNLANVRNRDHYPRLRRLGLPRVRLHDFRHFHATTLIAAGVDPRTVADRLGHSRPSFTLATYAHAVAHAQEQAVAVANGLLTESTRSRR